MRSEYARPRKRAHVRKIEISVRSVHGANIVRSRSTQNFDDFDHLTDASIANKEWLAEEQLRRDATNRPIIDRGGVTGGAKNQLRRPVVARANVRDAVVGRAEHLRRAKIAELKHARCWIKEQILRLHVAVADIEFGAVEEGESSAELEQEHPSVRQRHVLSLLREHFGEAAERVGNKFENQVEVQLVRLVPARVEAVLKRIDVWVGNFAQDGELSRLESLILKNLLYGYILSRFDDLGKVNNTKGTMSDDAFCVVRKSVAFNLIVMMMPCKSSRCGRDR